jgi:hypothetical protein
MWAFLTFVVMDESHIGGFGKVEARTTSQTSPETGGRRRD